MSTQDTDVRTSGIDWKAGLVGGTVGAFVMGLLMLLMNAPTLTVAIPSLYGLAPPANPVVGMAVHIFHGATLGVVFAAILRIVGGGSRTRTISIAVGWGVVTWLVLAGLLMPLWLSAVGSPANPPFPNFALPSLLWHVVYGVVLGGVYSALEGTL